MEMTGEQLIPAERDAVWSALNNPDVLKTCIPGCESLNLQSDNSYRISMLAAVGPVKARFNGKLDIHGITPPNGYTLSFEGSGGAAGFGKGGATVALEPADSGTRLIYTANADVSGKLAQVGSRLIDGVAKKMAAEFFARFKASFDPQPQATTNTASPAATLPQASAATPAYTRPGLEKELRAWQAIAVTAIAVACLAIGYIIGSR
jgi:carbon monoxide dehydrogenase subunit G